MAAMPQAIARAGVGPLLKEWRRRRHMSQLDLSLEADVSARHLSFIETGRARPSAEMVLHLAEQLDVPLRDRNQLLLAAGYAPAYGSVQSPMGGMKDSGLGRRHGSEGILKYTEAQTVAHQRILPMAPSLGMDDEKYAAFMSRSLRLMKAFRFR